MIGGATARFPELIGAGGVLSSRRVRLAILGLGDQAIVAGGNVVVMVILARELAPADFGVFTLAYAALLFANGMQAALITQPHNVLGATRHGDDYRRYTATTAVMQLALALGFGGLALASWAVARAFDSAAAPLLLVLAPTAVAWQLQEFGRRVLYTERRLGAAFAGDLISYGGQAIGIVALWQVGRAGGSAALGVIGATSLLAAVVSARQIRAGLGGRLDRAIVGENWRFGKWLAGGQVGYWLSSQFYLYLTAILLTTAAAGAIKASQVLLGPLAIFLSVLDSLLPSRFSRTAAAGGRGALAREVRLAYLLTLPIVAGYCLVVVFLAEPMLRLVYDDAYAGYGAVLALLAGYYLASYAARIVAIALRARGETRAIFTGYGLASLVALALGWLVTRLGGAEGAVLGMIASLLVFNAVVWRSYVQDRTS